MMIYKVGLKLETWKQDDDENLSIIDKTKHPTKGEEKVQGGKTQILANEETSKEEKKM
jgi:hypothetical protein